MTAVEQLRKWKKQYSNGEERPLGSYALLLGIYLSSVTAMTALARARRIKLPSQLGFADLVLVTVATFRAARLVSKDSVTAIARAPFTRFEGPAGHGEVNEEVTGTGIRHALGELLTCPFCISMWIATAAVFGLLAFPRVTRLICSVLGISAGADALQFAFAALQRLEGS